ncbi:hypothetical protein [Bradyrhizobium sp. LA7.1]|uniref:hypothetical protein n=1 Tax=Bradyrhizobium sp. LA7.1 TaxID=3156324 RepID=UPI00339A2D20
MNSIVSLPIAAAVPVSGPDVDPTLDRLTQAVEALRTSYVCEGWKLDEVGAERALAYVRRGCPDDDAEWTATLHFMVSHGLSFDWIFGGNPRSMVTTLASTSKQAAASSRLLDPIFAAIEAHKAARAKWIGWVDRHCALESELPKAKRQSRVNAWDDEIAETDDPRWIEAEREVDRASDAETEAACELVNVIPTTPAGVVALLNHAVAYDTDGEGWPRDLYSDDGKRRRVWQTFLIENLAEALPGIF